MGLSVIYKCTGDLQSDAIREIIDPASELASRRTWMSCEPLWLRAKNGVLAGSSKPRISPNPDDIAALSEGGLPDGTLNDLLHGLCELSKRFGISWEITHDYADGPLGYIRNGKIDDDLRWQCETLIELGDEMLGEGFDLGELE